MRIRTFYFTTLCACMATGLIAAPAPSPLGNWQATISGGAKGLAFITLSNDFSVTGYGMVIEGSGHFEISGTWSSDAKGNISIHGTENTFSEIFNGDTSTPTVVYNLSVTARVHGKTLVGKGGVADPTGSAQSCSFSVSAVPLGPVPNIAGTWSGKIVQGHHTTKGSVLIAPSVLFPNLFDVADPDLEISGELVATSRGQVVLLVETESVYFSYATGTFTSRAGSMSGKTVTSSGIVPFQVHASR